MGCKGSEVRVFSPRLRESRLSEILEAFFYFRFTKKDTFLFHLIPKIKTLSFEIKGKLSVTFWDGRMIVAPLSAFPSIKKLTMPQRKKWYLFGNGFSFDDCNEVFHIEQILGNSENYRHEGNGQLF